MKKNVFDTVIKIFGTLGVIFCISSLLMPWGSSTFTFGYFDIDSSMLFYSNVFTDQNIIESDYFNQLVYYALIMIIIFILTIFALIFGILSTREGNKENSSYY